mgnify:FL=1
MKDKKLISLSLILVLIFLSVYSIKPASAKIGSGRLYVYMDPDYTTLVPKDDNGHYMVFTGQTVYIQIANITEFEVGNLIHVKICWEDHTKWFINLTVKILTSGIGAGEVGVGDKDDPIEWVVGEFEDGTYNIPDCETITVHYTYQKRPEYITINDEFPTYPSIVAHMHSVIPEVPLGTLTVLILMFGALKVYLRPNYRPT